MVKKKLVRMFVVALTTVFLFSGCAAIGLNVEKNDTTEFVIKQVGRSLGYKISDRKPDSICKVREVSESFLQEANKEDYSEGNASVFVNVALNYLKDQIQVEDEILKMGLRDLIQLVEIDIDKIQVTDDNLALIKLAVESYLEGLRIVAEQRSIECE